MVYLVDDDYDDLELIHEALVMYNYKGPVVSLENGRKLIDQLTHPKSSPYPEVIILDLNMPLLDGFQTLKSIRNHAAYSSIPVIILTSSSKKEDEIKSYELGCNFYFNKPSKMSDYEALATLVKEFTEASAK